jgi:hypothetical protein
VDRDAPLAVALGSGRRRRHRPRRDALGVSGFRAGPDRRPGGMDAWATLRARQHLIPPAASAPDSAPASVLDAAAGIRADTRGLLHGARPANVAGGGGALTIRGIPAPHVRATAASSRTTATSRRGAFIHSSSKSRGDDHLDGREDADVRRSPCRSRRGRGRACRALIPLELFATGATAPP